MAESYQLYEILGMGRGEVRDKSWWGDLSDSTEA